MSERARHWPYLAPLLAALLIWVYGPLAGTVVLSFLRWNLTSGPAAFAGLANYRALPLSLAIALWKRPGRAASGYRCLLFIPLVLAPVATAISWQFALNPLQGIVHTMSAAVGVPAPNLLGDPRTALWIIDLITSGKMIALNILLFGAALGAIDPCALEAARIEGATETQVTWHVVIPQVRRTIAALGMLTAVYGGQWSFTSIAVLTQGGPLNSTDNIYYLIYTYGFTYFDIGRAAAASAGTSP